MCVGKVKNAHFTTLKISTFACLHIRILPVAFPNSGTRCNCTVNKAQTVVSSKLYNFISSQYSTLTSDSLTESTSLPNFSPIHFADFKCIMHVIVSQLFNYMPRFKFGIFCKLDNIWMQERIFQFCCTIMFSKLHRPYYIVDHIMVITNYGLWFSLEDSHTTAQCRRPCVTSAQTAHNLDNCLSLQMCDVFFMILIDVSGKPRFRVTIVVCIVITPWSELVLEQN